MRLGKKNRSRTKSRYQDWSPTLAPSVSISSVKRKPVPREVIPLAAVANKLIRRQSEQTGFNHDLATTNNSHRERAGLATVFGPHEYTESTAFWCTSTKADVHGSSKPRAAPPKKTDNRALPNSHTQAKHGIRRSSTMPNLDHELPEIPIVSTFQDLLQSMDTPKINDNNPLALASPLLRLPSSDEPGFPAGSDIQDRQPFVIPSTAPWIHYDHVPAIFDLLADDNDKRIIRWESPSLEPASICLPKPPITQKASKMSSLRWTTQSSQNSRRRRPWSLVLVPGENKSVESKENTSPHKPSSDELMIEAATVEKLVEKLTISLAFLTPTELCKLIMLRFEWALENNEGSRQIVRIRTFVVLRHWLLNYFVHDFMPCRELRVLLTTFLNAISHHPIVQRSPRDRRIIKGLKRVVRRLKTVYYQGSRDQVRVVQPPPPTWHQARVEAMARTKLSMSTLRRKADLGVNVGDRHHGNTAIRDARDAPVVIVGSLREPRRYRSPSTSGVRRHMSFQIPWRPPTSPNGKETMMGSQETTPANALDPSSAISHDSLVSALSPGTTVIEGVLDTASPEEQSIASPGMENTNGRWKVDDHVRTRLEQERRKREEMEEQLRAEFFSGTRDDPADHVLSPSESTFTRDDAKSQDAAASSSLEMTTPLNELYLADHWCPRISEEESPLDRSASHRSSSSRMVKERSGTINRSFSAESLNPLRQLRKGAKAVRSFKSLRESATPSLVETTHSKTSNSDFLSVPSTPVLEHKLEIQEHDGELSSLQQSHLSINRDKSSLGSDSKRNLSSGISTACTSPCASPPPEMSSDWMTSPPNSPTHKIPAKLKRQASKKRVLIFNAKTLLESTEPSAEVPPVPSLPMSPSANASRRGSTHGDVQSTSSWTDMPPSPEILSPAGSIVGRIAAALRSDEMLEEEQPISQRTLSPKLAYEPLDSFLVADEDRRHSLELCERRGISIELNRMFTESQVNSINPPLSTMMLPPTSVLGIDDNQSVPTNIKELVDPSTAPAAMADVTGVVSTLAVSPGSQTDEDTPQAQGPTIPQPHLISRVIELNDFGPEPSVKDIPLFRHSWLLTTRSGHIAQQLCLIERDVLLHVDWEELVHCRWTKMNQGDTSNAGGSSAWSEKKGLERVIERFNCMCEWVSSEIVRTERLHERVQVVEKFIRLARKCFLYSNYATLVQILLGLQSPSVARLHKTWAKVSAREHKTLQELSHFTSPMRNWKHIRDSMTIVADEFGMSPTEVQIEMPGSYCGRSRKTRIKYPFGGCIPFLGIYLSDLVFNAEHAPFLESEALISLDPKVAPPLLRQPLVNYRKHRITATVIKRVLIFQGLARRYAFEEDQDMYQLCCDLDPLDANTIRQLSHGLEP